MVDYGEMTTTLTLPDRVRTSMILPNSKETYFNTNWKSKQVKLCAYDMLYHPPDYNPKSARSDRQEIKIIRKNIWDQVCNHFTKFDPRLSYLSLSS